MASALRYPIPLQDALPGWRKRLMERLPLQADSPESYRIHYYDSFDWRLFRCGTALKWEQRDGESRCYLYKLDGGAGIASLPRSEPPPKFAADLPAGRLGQRLSARLGVRALLPLATLEVRSHCLRLKDPEGKTRLRLFLEQLAVWACADIALAAIDVVNVNENDRRAPFPKALVLADLL